ncbi:MAG: substrate-binding domain-containing protein, partial [Bryobacteraceae bacterium]
METANRIQEFRQSRGLSAAELARRAGVSRQTVYAMESGTYVPNTTIALRLARSLETSVEELFSLPGESEEAVNAELLPAGEGAARKEQMVRLCRVGERVVAISAQATPHYLPAADAIVMDSSRTGVSVRPVHPLPDDGKRILVAGCDPAFSLLAADLRLSGFDMVAIPCSSRQALAWLKEGRVHAAGCHLLDRATGVYNVPLIRKMFPRSAVRLHTFASWEAGLVARPGNPKQLRSIADLGRKGVSIVNREKGSGSRDLLDHGLAAAGIDPKTVKGYGQTAHGHLPAASEVASGKADCCIATRSAARCFGLDFVPLAAERFDLSIAKPWMEMPAVKALLDSLNRSALRRVLRDLAGYDASQTG